jgi:2-oxoglutarate dehydrogenase E2 component (dihydrolipoamide succinyltransferase)
VPGQPVAEIGTGKATVEVEAEAGGVVHEILLQPGQDVNVGDVILRLDETV